MLSFATIKQSDNIKKCSCFLEKDVIDNFELYFQQYMYIDGPEFVRRRVVNSKKDNQFFQFGKERDQLVSHVYSALNAHQKDQEILEKFRREAEEKKRRKYQSKRKAYHSSFKQEVNSSRLHVQDNRSFTVQEPKLEQKETETRLEVHTEQIGKEVSHMLRNSNDLVDKYRKLLNLKEKELRKREKKLESSKMAMQKMSLKIKELEKERARSQREEQLQMSKIALTLKQMSNQIAQNKTTAARQVSSLKQELKPSFSEELSSNRKTDKSRVIQPKQNISVRKPNREHLEVLKKKAKSLKYASHVAEQGRSPSVLYTKLPTQVSRVLDSPSQRSRLNKMSKSIIDQSNLRVLPETESLY